MKILNATTAFSSDNQFESLDLSLQEKSSKQQVQKIAVDRRTRRIDPNRIDPGRLLDRVLVDRISIQKQDSLVFQSNYSAHVSAVSRVTDDISGQTAEFLKQSDIEKLVGGLINRQVVVDHIEQKQDVTMPLEKSGQADDSQKRESMSTRLEIAITNTDIHFEDQQMNFASAGQVKTEDGRTIDFSLDLAMNQTFLSRKEEQTLIQRWQESVTLTDPLVISLDGQAPVLTDTRFEFDLDSDGDMETINFVGQGSGFLAFDKNRDQTINNGSELFGPGTGNGFEELAALDQDQNNWIDENDAVFSQLSVWTKDEQGNDRLVSLKEAGIGAIALDYAATTFNMTRADNTLQGKMQRTGAFLFETGQVGSVHQVDLVAHDPEPVQELQKKHLHENSGEPSQTESSIFPMPQMPSLSTAEQAESGSMENPLKALLDRIEKIKEEMGRLYESMNPLYNPKRYGSNRSGRGGHRYDNGIRLDSSVLLSGRHHRGRARRADRYA